MVATSRTGTAQYKAWRKQVMRDGQRKGITHCPCRARCKHHLQRPCAVPLDYTKGLQPNSAEPDHITPWNRGGANVRENGAVLCRRCNQAQGDKKGRTSPQKARAAFKTIDFT